MKKEVIQVAAQKRKPPRMGVLPTYVQRDRTRYQRHAKHKGRETDLFF